MVVIGIEPDTLLEQTKKGQLSFLQNYVESANVGIREIRLLILGNQRLKMMNTSGHAAMK